MRKICAVLTMLLMLFAVLNGVVKAAPTMRTTGRSEQPIQLKANELSTDSNNRTATFTGNVIARQGDITIFCDRLVVHYGEKEQEVTQVEAYGNVRIVQGNRQAQAGRAHYDNRAGTILLEENPKVSQGDDWVTGKTITFYVNEQKSTVTGGARAVIHPKGTESNVGTKP